jgi:hypothetical protein
MFVHNADESSKPTNVFAPTAENNYTNQKANLFGNQLFSFTLRLKTIKRKEN